MSNPYVGSKITGCNSPAIGNDRSTYSGVIDAAMQAIDTHDHTSGKGSPITASAISPKTITAAQIAAGTITTAEIAANAGIVGTQLAAGTVTPDRINSNRQISALEAAGSYTSTTPVLSVNLTVSITVKAGSDVHLTLFPVGAGALAAQLAAASSSNVMQVTISLYRNGLLGALVGSHLLSLAIPTGGTTLSIAALASYSFIDVNPGAGTYTYAIAFNVDGVTTKAVTQNLKLYAREVQ